MTTPSPQPNVNFAEQLVGLTLQGWEVESLIDHRALDPNATGGNFSKSYIVSSEGKRAFLKAFDLAAVLGRQTARPRAEVLSEMAGDYAFEQKVLGRCANMDRIVRVLGSGDVLVDERNDYSWVPYIIFELASSDVRKHLDGQPRIGVGWLLRAFHHIAVAMAQLHREHIAHQDLKPSNALVFDAGGLKLADLGRASLRGDPHRLLTSFSFATTDNKMQVIADTLHRSLSPPLITLIRKHTVVRNCFEHSGGIVREQDARRLGVATVNLTNDAAEPVRFSPGERLTISVWDIEDLVLALSSAADELFP